MAQHLFIAHTGRNSPAPASLAGRSLLYTQSNHYKLMNLPRRLRIIIRATLGKRRHEARWPTYLAIITTVLLYISLPDRLTFGPTWLVPALVILLLVPLIIFVPEEYSDWPTWRRVTGIVLIGLINVANLISLVFVVDALLSGRRGGSAELIIESIKIWSINVLCFSLWYWELDGGGPAKRTIAKGSREYPDFLFPQMVTQKVSEPDWEPSYVDYLYLSFTNATAFSPTDTMPLTPTAKMLMLVQSVISLLTIALVAARAVNILPSQQ